MKASLAIVAFFGMASLGLSGCVVNIGDDEARWNGKGNWEQVQRQNIDNLARLSIGMSKEQVTALMGSADFSEAYLKSADGQGEKEIQVLFYRTQWNQGDGKTTKDECTPVVLQNNALVGWGETAYSNI
jgi:hypothetical protein